MYLSHLSLNHFRNYHALDLDLQGGLTLLQGLNAHGKSNLLEAIYYLATSKPVHAQSEREIVDWQAQDEPIPYCRVAATVHADASNPGRTTELEIILTPRGDGQNYKKQVKVNGNNRRSMDLVGQMQTVLFLPEDIKLVAGSPSERRRYLDIALCQIDRTYCRTLSAYQKVLTQRNSLLKNLREQGAHAREEAVIAQLSFWDEKLVSHGSHVMARRHNFIGQLLPTAQSRHAALTQGREEFALYYVPTFNLGQLSPAEFQQFKENTAEPPPLSMTQTPLSAESVVNHFYAHLNQRRPRELAAGNTLYGPHRDDLRLYANARDLRTYGSRGQQRTAALSLKLAEVQTMTETTGTTPLLLLDDVMSELDVRRRDALLSALDGVEQAILTTTDWEDFTPDFRERARLLQVDDGRIEPWREFDLKTTG